MKYLPLIWYGIWRKRGRAMLILLQVVVAFLLFGLLQGMKSGIDAAIKGIGADIFVVNRDTPGAPLPLAQFGRIQSVPGVESVRKQSYLVGAYQKPNQQVVALATDVAALTQWQARRAGFAITAGTVQAMSRSRNGALVGNKLAKKYGWKIGDRIPLESQMPQQDGSRSWQFEVLGLIEDADPLGLSQLMVINYDYFNEARMAQKNTVQQYVLRMADPAKGVLVAQQIDSLFVNSSDETRTEAASEQVQSQFQQIGDLNFIVRAVVGAAMFALLFSTATMMMQSIRERTPELAVLKTLGFSDRRVFGLILAEVTTLCLVAAALGLVASSRAVPSISRYVGIELNMPVSVLLAGLGIALGLSAVSAALPAWRGLRLQVAEALAGR